MSDPRESSSYSVTPRLRYNTVGGVNGPLVILDNVGDYLKSTWGLKRPALDVLMLITCKGQISEVQ